MISVAKGISDPVHGTISLSEVEARVISTRAFQRLRGVKQLGLASMVYPGADYSRFSHSLGVCHITSRIITALRNNSDVSISDEQEQRYRLAGLLHDVGHYPFSHAMEKAVNEHYSALLTQPATAESTPAGPANSVVEVAKWLDHESIGKEVLRDNAEMRDVLNEHGHTPETVYQIFAREQPPDFSNLVSSDLDADRIDFLLRTARHTGLPYGAVDLDYLLSQMRVDGSNHVCLSPKALRVADHLLLARYFDYQQVAFHKTVAGLEWVLVEVIKALLSAGLLDCSTKAMRERIASSQWDTFDDTELITCIRALRESTHDSATALKADAILLRRPPKLMNEIEYLAPRDKFNAGMVKNRKRDIDRRVRDWSDEFGIPIEQWHVWEGGLTFTKVGSNVPISALAADTAYDPIDPDKTEQAVRILDPRTNQSEPIMSDKRSLMSVLADKALYSLRLYVVLSEDRLNERSTIAAKIHRDLNDT